MLECSHAWAVENQAICTIKKLSSATAVTDPRFREAALFVLGELWKTKVVELMKGENGGAQQEFASEKVLNGLFAVNHLLLALAQDDPGRRLFRSHHLFRSHSRMLRTLL
jgi:hypothetical protein